MNTAEEVLTRRQHWAAQTSGTRRLRENRWLTGDRHHKYLAETVNVPQVGKAITIG